MRAEKSSLRAICRLTHIRTSNRSYFQYGLKEVWSEDNMASETSSKTLLRFDLPRGSEAKYSNSKFRSQGVFCDRLHVNLHLAHTKNEYSQTDLSIARYLIQRNATASIRTSMSDFSAKENFKWNEQFDLSPVCLLILIYEYGLMNMGMVKTARLCGISTDFSIVFQKLCNTCSWRPRQ